MNVKCIKCLTHVAPALFCQNKYVIPISETLIKYRHRYFNELWVSKKTCPISQ